MIIKKKYAKVNINKEEIKQEVLPQETEVLSTKAGGPEETISEVTDIDEKEETSAEKDNSSLNLSITDINFEPRAERRDGTRRRGYRRTLDRNIVSRAQKEAQSIREMAKQDGYKEGIDKAVNDINELKNKLSEFYTYKEYVFQKVSECIYDISVEIAKKIINNQIEADKSSLISIIQTAVKEVNKTEEKITLKVMPKDVEIVRDSLPDIFVDKSFEAKISVVPDTNIKEGGVIIETSNGIIDATLETQIAIIEKALKTSAADSESNTTEES